jgi:hypothetical protein
MNGINLKLWAGIAAIAIGPAPAAMAQAGYTVGHTAWGAPDFQGVWTNSSITRLTRPPGIDHLVLTPEEARKLEAADFNNQRTAAEKAPTDQSTGAPQKAKSLPSVGNYNAVWVDPGSKVATIRGELRSSWIVEPANGRIPMSAAGRKKMSTWRPNATRDGSFTPPPVDPLLEPKKVKATKAKPAKASAAPKVKPGEKPFVDAATPPARSPDSAAPAYDGPEARGAGERCLIGFGATGGPVMNNVLYNNHYQVIQSPDHVVLDVEMTHDARIIPIYKNMTEAEKHFGPAAIPKWLGDSVGWYEGDTLVIETRNVNRQQGGPVWISDTGKMTERLTRVGADDIVYEFRIEDPEVYTQPWRGEISWRLTPDNVYEYACHEGNYAMPGILAGARKQEREGVSLEVTRDSEG